jgi:hypothetical protein
MNPAFALTGGSGDARVRSMVRERLRTGELWAVNGRSVWSGYGSGKACVVCRLPIGGAEVEYEAQGPDGPAVAHLTCFMIWHRESQLLTAEEPQ